MFYSFLICSVFFPIFFRVFLSCLFRIRICTCSPFVLRLFSVYSSFVFNLFYVCFPPSLYLFFICCHLFYAHSSFLPHLFSICFFIYFPFIFHLFFISFPIYFSVHLPFFHEAKYGSCAVKAQYRFVAWSIFRLKFPRSQRMDVKAKRKVFRERLCTSDLIPR